MSFEHAKLTDRHEKLAALAGTFAGDETFYPSAWKPEGGPAKGRFEGRVAANGFFVLTDYTCERGGQVVYRGHGVMGWDAKKDAFTMHWFDSMGDGSDAPALGKLEGNVLRFEHAHAMGWSAYVYTFEADGSYQFRIENAQDGRTWRPFMEGRYRRQ